MVKLKNLVIGVLNIYALVIILIYGISFFYLFTFFFFIRSYVSTGGLGEALEYVGVEEGAHTYLVKLKAHSKGKPRKVKEESLVRRFRGYSCFEDVVETEQRSKIRRSDDRLRIRDLNVEKKALRLHRFPSAKWVILRC